VPGRDPSCLALLAAHGKADAVRNLSLVLGAVFVVALAACKPPAPADQQPSADVRAAGSRNVSIAEAEALLQADKKIVVLDVRTPEEFAAAHILGAKNVNFNGPDFKTAVGTLDRDATYLVHCQAGGRSARASATMKELQFKSVLHMNEGFGEWEAAGKPAEK
jgi:phage shock protein E